MFDLRKTGYKIYERYKDCGVHGLTDRSRRPYRHANQLPMPVEKTILALKREYPCWGAPKIRERLTRRWPGLRCPAISTVHAVLDRHDLVTHRRGRPHRAEGTTRGRHWPNALCATAAANSAADRRYCYPLTVTDYASRYLLCCEGLTSAARRVRLSVFERVPGLWRPRGDPTDNGAPSRPVRSTAQQLLVCGCPGHSPERTCRAIPNRMAAMSV